MAKTRKHIRWMSLRNLIIAIVLLATGAACAPAPNNGGQAPQATDAMPAHDMRSVFPKVDEIYDKIEAEGVVVEFTVKSEDAFFGPKNVEASGLATVKFRVTDAKSGQPVTGVFPKAWIDRQRPAAASSDTQQLCQQQVATYLKGTLTDRPEVDLNSFFILALNNEASISVIDPLVNLAGITQLYAMIELPKPGEDWALAQDQTRLFVTVPEAGQVAVADTSNFQLLKTLNLGGVPVRIAWQPDEKYVWVGNDAEADGGVVALDPAELKVAARFATGAGHHALAFSPDSRYAFVTNEKSNTLSIIDTTSLSKVKDVPVGALPVAVGVSALTRSVYVANGKDGTVTVLDGERFEPRATLPAAPGLYALQFTPDGRWGFVTNPGRNEVSIIDAANERMAHTLAVDGAPDQISFSPTAAYVRSFDKPQVGIIQLADLEKSGPAVTTMTYAPVAPGKSPYQSVANAMAPSVRDQSMLIASPGDNLIYYYTEGETSPAGSFQSYGRTPRAVRVVDRGFRQEAPGIYSARFRVPDSGDFNVALLLDNPRLTHCFKFSAKPDSTAATPEPGAPPKIEFLTQQPSYKTGEEIAVRFALSDAATQARLADLKDVIVLVSQAGGNWNQRLTAAHAGEGVYEARFTAPQPGIYRLIVTIPSAKVGLGQLPQGTVQVVK